MALGLIEAIGLSTAMVALDAATKSADVTLIGCDRVIGVDKKISITLNLTGDVAAVQSAIQAGKAAGNRVGQIVSSHVIASPHNELDKIIGKYEKSFLPGRASRTTGDESPSGKDSTKTEE
jgi:microcompartment protein CcmL/EutN